MSANAKFSPPDEVRSTADRVRPSLPPLKALLAFEAAARHASFAQGAAELGVTPSAISHQIQQLEAFMGVTLFARHAGRASLTSAGQAYVKEIEHAFGVIARATALVAPQSQSGHLVIASGPSFAAKWLRPRLAEFVRLHPGLKVRVSTLSTRDLLDSERFDVAVTYGRPTETGTPVEPLLVESLRPLCSPGLAADLDLRSPRDLERTTLIHSLNALTWAEYLRRIGEADLRPSDELWLDRSTMAIEAAVDGAGVVLESEILASTELADGRLIAPFSGDAYAVRIPSYFIIRGRGFRVGSHVAAFERWLKAEVKRDIRFG